MSRIFGNAEIGLITRQIPFIHRRQSQVQFPHLQTRGQTVSNAPSHFADLMQWCLQEREKNIGIYSRIFGIAEAGLFTGQIR